MTRPKLSRHHIWTVLFSQHYLGRLPWDCQQTSTTCLETESWCPRGKMESSGRINNIQADITDLPAEVLEEIFSLLPEDFLLEAAKVEVKVKAHSEFHLIVITKVCQQWLQVSHSLARTWSLATIPRWFSLSWVRLGCPAAFTSLEDWVVLKSRHHPGYWL